MHVAKNKIFVDLQTLPKCINLYGGLNISRIKVDNPQNCKISKNFPLKIFRLYGMLICTLLSSTIIVLKYTYA